MTQVREVMGGPVVSIGPEDAPADAAQLMRDDDTGAVQPRSRHLKQKVRSQSSD